MKSKNEIKPIDINGEEIRPGDDRLLIVESHWNFTDRVHLKFGDLNIVVIAGELERAIANAKNHRR